MRIVSLLPSATEIVCALGLEHDLVGVTHECDYPPSVRGKPILTSSVVAGAKTSGEIDRHIRRLVHEGSSIYALDADRLHALHPDLILTQELCEVCAVSYPVVEHAVRRLEGPTQIVSLEPETLEDVYETIRTVGRLTDRTDRADDVIAQLAERVAAVRQRVVSRPARRIVCLEWVDPPYNCGHWTPELVTIAGGQDLLGTPGQPAHPLDAAALADVHPEVMVVMACGFGWIAASRRSGTPTVACDPRARNYGSSMATHSSAVPGRVWSTASRSWRGSCTRMPCGRRLRRWPFDCARGRTRTRRRRRRAG